jgi:hypothetical protein
MKARAVPQPDLACKPKYIGMWWYLLQSSIMFAVMASNIHWHWTPNGYVPALLGIGLAYLATLLVQHIMFKDFWRRS